MIRSSRLGEFIIVAINMKRLLLVLASLTFALSLYCASRCADNTYVDCSTSGPSYCTNCDPNYYLAGGCLSGSATGISIIEYASETTTPVLSLWATNSVNTNQTCVKDYLFYAVFTFNFYRTLVGGDYLYRSVPISTSHYQLKIKFSLAFIGVWAIDHDFIWLHLSDTYQTHDINLTYVCDSSSNGTQRLCNVLAPNSYNAVDCLQNFEYTFNHNSTFMEMNFSSLSNNRDSTTQFWNLFDIIIATVDCDVACRTCTSNTASSCLSCSDYYYYVDNNTCTASCSGTTPYIMPSATFPNTGDCVALCPQGYYLSGTACQPCQSGCLTCTNGTACTLSTALSVTSLWQKYLTLWVILIIIGVLLLIGLLYRLACYSPPVSIQSMRMIHEEGKAITYEERLQVNETFEREEANIHIEEIDYRDNVMVDNNPRRRKRLERDLNRTRGTSFG